MRLESFGMTAKKCWIERPFSRRKRRLTLYFWRYIFLWKTHLFPLNRWKYLKYWFFSAKWHAICLFYDYYLSFAQNSLKRSRTLRSNFMLNLVGICLPIFICLDLWKQNWRPNQTFFLGRGDDRKIKRRVSLFSRALVYIFSFYFCPFPISVFFSLLLGLEVWNMSDLAQIIDTIFINPVINMSLKIYHISYFGQNLHLTFSFSSVKLISLRWLDWCVIYCQYKTYSALCCEQFKLVVCWTET